MGVLWVWMTETQPGQSDIQRGRGGLDLPALEQYFARHVSLVKPPLQAQLIAGGFSNLTYRIDDATGQRFVLRRPPLGRPHSRAHDVGREHRILAALGPTDVPVPRVVCLVEDVEVIGAPFYVMHYVNGSVIDTPAIAQKVWPTEALRHRAAYELVDSLATLHSLDVNTSPLADLGPHEDYLVRQIERLRQTWERNKTRELPIVEALAAQLMANRPPQSHTGLVHSDYRFGNTIVDANGRLAAVLDWELCAIGDVLVDVGLLVNNWDQPNDPSPGVWMQEAPTRIGGFPDRAQIVERYARQTGFEIHHLDYYRAFGYWKICVIAEGIKRRYLSGAMAEGQVDLEQVERRVRQRAALAEQFFNLWIARADKGQDDGTPVMSPPSTTID
jgi:aminoglycoside phosphotransferase (APT) family kinase protein